MHTSEVFAATENLVHLSLESPRPRPRRQSLLGRRGLNRCAAIFTQLPFTLPNAPTSRSPTKTVHSAKSPPPTTPHSPRRSQNEDTFHRHASHITPAQNVIVQYRQKLASEVVNDSVDTPTLIEETSHSQPFIDFDHLRIASSTPSMFRVVPRTTEPKPRPDKDREVELRRAYHEATMILARSDIDGLLRCSRAGCHDLLRNVRALSFHLHIHNIHNAMITCTYCGAKFDSREENLHVCSPPTSTSGASSSEDQVRGAFHGLLSRLNWA